MFNIFESIDKNDAEEIELLLKQNPSILKSTNSDGITPLLYSLYSGKIQLAQLLYIDGIDFTIHECIGMADMNKVRQLIESDTTIVNSYSQDGWTPLHLAAFWGNTKIVLLLLESGAILDLPSKSKASLGNSALQAAIAMQKTEIVEILLAKGANPNYLQMPGEFTPLHIAASRDNEKILTLLLNYGADKSKKSSDGRMPIDIARERGMKKNMSLLSS